MKDNFKYYHPIVNFIFFVSVIGIVMFVSHPIVITFALVGSLFYTIRLIGFKKAMKYFLIFILPMFVLITLINPIFNHYGVTQIAYFSNGNAITLEALIYGAVMGSMFACMLLWFRCYMEVMTSDKFIYLFGRIMPAFSLAFSICVGLIPKFKNKYLEITNAQKLMGNYYSGKNLIKKISQGMKEISILITWVLENSIETSNSMKCRGYGIEKRTTYSIYKFNSRDCMTVIVLLIALVIVIIGIANGTFFVQYNPNIDIAFGTNFVECVVYISVAVLNLFPFFVKAGEKINGFVRN